MTAEQVMTAYLAAWARGDPETALAFYADDMVMRLPGRAPDAGVHRGREAVVACIRSLLSRIDDLAVEVEVFEGGRYGVDAFFGAAHAPIGEST